MIYNQGITKNYPQYGTNFWGNPDNNYGFGSSNIHDNIENRENQTEKSYGFGNNNQNQSVWNKNQYQTPTPWAKQSTSLGRNQPVQTKPVYENPNPRRYSTEEILWDGVKGFGQGALGGLERGINSATYGLYDFVSDLADNGGYERRQKELENSANQVGLEKPYKYLNYLIDYAASGLTTSGGYNIANKALKGYKFM